MDVVGEAREAYDAIAGPYLARKLRQGLHRYVEDALARVAAAVPAGSRVLDVGCGHGFEMAAMRAHGLLPFGVDNSFSMLKTASERAMGNAVQGDARRLPFKTGTFAAVVSFHALLHLSPEHLPVALAEIRRVSAAGALVVVSLLAGSGVCREEAAYAPGTFRTFTYWEPEALADQLRLAGIGDVQIMQTAEAGGSVVAFGVA